MKTLPFFSVGFRPLFSSGVLFGALALFIWADFWQLSSAQSALFAMNPVGGMMFWHPHELIMGFAMAIVMGFLLTAVRNWTGLETASPLGLFVIWIFWVFARFVMMFGGDYSYNLIVTSQLLPVILTAAFIAYPIIKKRMWRNLFAPLVLVLFAMLDIAIINQMYFDNVIPSGLIENSIFVMLFLITMIAGRIIPFFTANKLGIDKWVEPKVSLMLSVLPLLAIIIANFFPTNLSMDGFKTGCFAILVFSHGLRLMNWHHKGIWLQPMLSSLWLSYAFMPVGFLLYCVSPFHPLGSIPLHVITIGTLCGLIVSMVSRVSLGHTGRVIKHDPFILGVLLCMLIALLVRTFAIMLVELSSGYFIVSALFAAGSLSILFVRFIYVWLTPRPDNA